jgi:hypothetical protein
LIEERLHRSGLGTHGVSFLVSAILLKQAKPSFQRQDEKVLLLVVQNPREDALHAHSVPIGVDFPTSSTAGGSSTCSATDPEKT